MRDEVRGLVEDHWRVFLPLAASGNGDVAMELVAEFQRRIDRFAANLPEDQRELFMLLLDIERDAIADEYDADPVALKRRLGLVDRPPAPVSVVHVPRQRMGLGEVAVRTAVRATVWESIIALFGLWRR